MTDEAQPSDTPAAATLDEVISDFNVTPKQSAPEQTPVQQPVQHLDVYNETDMNKWAVDTRNQQDVLRTEIQSLKNDAQSRTDAESKRVMEENIKSAVDVITKGIEGIDPLMAELLLEKTARDNKKFGELFHNQKDHAEMYEKSLAAIVSENEGKFKRVDSQIAENHRAAKSSQQSNNTPKAKDYGNSLEQRLAEAKNDNERAFIWENIKTGGY